MALIIADRVKETTITEGAGTITLSGRTFGGFQTFAEAIGNGNITYYCIQNDSQFEIGLGTYTSSTNSLSRDTVFQSSNSDNKININGVGIVFCVVPADKLVYKDDDDAVVFPTPFVFKRSDDGDYWQAFSTDYTNRVASFYIDEGADPTWKIGLKTSQSEIIAPYYAYVSAKDGFIELRGNSSSILSIGDEDAQGLQVNHQLKNIIDIRKNGGEIAIQNLDLTSDETTTAKNNSVAYTVFAVESSAAHASDLQTWSVATDQKASLNQYGDFETLGSFISPSGRFSAIRFSDSSIQTTAGLPFGSGALIDQNTQGLVSQSGYFQSYIDGLDHSATAVSGWAESYIDQTSGNLQSQIDINESNISTVSGLIGDADFLPGGSGGLIDQNTQDILTVSGLLYDDSAVSGYFESRVDSADSDISTVSGLLTPSGESFNFAGNVLTYNNSDGGSFTADLSSLSTFDTSGVSLGYSAGTLTYTNNAGGTFDVDLSSISGDVYAMIVDGAPATLDTLNEIAAALNDDSNIANTLTTLISTTSGNLQSQITSNDGDITQLNSDVAYVSGVAVYASGHNLQTVSDNGASTTNALTITNNNITASSGLFDSLDMTPLAEANYPAHQEGVVFYDADNHTLSLYNDEADVTLQLGQEEFLRVRNNTGATITNGTAVLITGSHGSAAPTISGAIATSESTSQIVGLATHSIEDSSFGYVTTYGIVRNVDTSHCAAGDEIFLSATEVGSGVNVSPTIPNYKVTIGHVIRSHGANGSILVQIGHPKLGGGDLKSEAELNLSGVPFVTTKSDTTAGGSQTDPLFIFDSGNRQLQLGSGLQLLDGQPSNLTNVLYNVSGSLMFNGDEIGGNVTGVPSGISFFDDAGSLSGNSSLVFDGQNITLDGYIDASGQRVITSEDIHHITQLTQSEYDAITPDSATFYIITDAPSISGYFESRVDQADSDIATVSGLLDSVNPTGTPSGISFFDDSGSLSGNNSLIYDGQDIKVSGRMFASGEQVITSDEIFHIKQLTQAEYDVITPDSATFYIITDAATEGPVIQPIKTVSSDYTILASDYTVYTTAALTLTLPSAAGNQGVMYNIKNISTGLVTVSGVSGDTIDGQPSVGISTQYQSISLQSTNSDWIIV